MSAVRSFLMVAVLALAVLPAPAQAGRRSFIWVYDTEIVPKGDVELEQWLWARTQSQGVPGDKSRYWIWWGPVFGLTQRLELALPFQIQATRDSTQLDSFDADLRLRLNPRGDDSPWQPLLRVAWHQSIHTSRPSRVEANLVQSYEAESGLRLVLDLGSQVGFPGIDGSEAPVQWLGTYAAGVSYPISEEGELRASLEAFGEVPLQGLQAKQHHFVGADLAWTFGRSWITLGVLVGLTPLFPETPQFMPRLIWAVVL
ncbi:hypothetical protein [Vitiosangium sp. GDMCC 1.1324]|uniref:hypothetical protein n=1 Tax=Vitiosangium sp. (strain GDMCC 1.1324) TaxID=2138576 RepID=UPI000D38B290|nr:hypothetical protein [Vitiosangium sp. GDMCC 1.1324]PTL76262.1 hypothetical protein DAT35_50360 [Vitiosangium sp. GDMCC 1.1324]